MSTKSAPISRAAAAADHAPGLSSFASALMRSSNERVARALATARVNIVRLDPKCLASIRALAPTREQELAARLRQERVARTLGDARATVAMLAELQTPLRRPTCIPEGWGRGLALPECT